jgi:hypothetical protein
LAGRLAVEFPERAFERLDRNEAHRPELGLRRPKRSPAGRVVFRLADSMRRRTLATNFQR